MLKQLHEAWGLFKKRFWSWLAIGFVAAAVEMGLGYALSFHQKPYSRSEDLPFIYGIGALIQAVAFLIAGGMILAALHQSRTGQLSWRKLLVPESVAPTLVVLGVVSTLTYHAVYWIATTLIGIPYGWLYLVWLLAGPPFVLTIPLVVEKRHGPVRATKESVRLAAPKYLPILIAQFLVWFYTALAIFPFFCVAQAAPTNYRSSEWAFLIPGVAVYAFALPLYYLTVSQIFLAIVPDPGNEEPAENSLNPPKTIANLP